MCGLESLRKTKHVTVLVSNCGKHAKRAGNLNFGFTTVCAKTCGRITIKTLFNTFFAHQKRTAGLNHRWQTKNTDGSTGV